MGQITAGEVLGAAAVLAAATVIAVVVYRALARPRLRLVPEPDGRGGWRATRRDTFQYAVSIPFLVLGWVTALGTVLIAIRTDMSGAAILVAASAIVIACRLLAHVVDEAARELAKTLPLTLVTLVLIRGDVRDVDGLRALAGDLATVQETVAAMVITLTADYAFTAAWYWIGVRGLARRGRSVPGVPAHASGAARPFGGSSSGSRGGTPDHREAGSR